MDYTYVSIDIYNKSVTCRFGGTTYIFSSPQKFVDLTGFPFLDTVRMLSYEPERNLYVIEYAGGVANQGGDLEEMRWIGANIGNIHQAAMSDQHT